MIFILSTAIWLICLPPDIFGQFVSTEPLEFWWFDARDGLKTTITWNKNSFDPSRVRRISYRETGFRNQNQLPNTAFRTSVVRQNGPWSTMAEGGQEWEMSYYFIKPKFCHSYEFCVVSDFNDDVRPSENVVFSNGRLEEPCRGISQVLGIPPVKVSNSSSLRVRRIFYNGGQVQVVMEGEPMFDYWRSSIMNILRANVTSERCRSLVPGTVPEPFVDSSMKMITFDPAYVLQGCTFRYQVTVDLSMQGEPCSVTYTTPMNESVPINLSCREIPGIPECSTVVATASSVFRTDSCHSCDPDLTTQAVIEYNDVTNRFERKVKIQWSFPENDRPDRIPTEFKIRWSKTDLIGSFHEGSREIDPVYETQPYYRKFLTLPNYEDYRFTTPSYLVQVCAIYRPECSNVIWEREPKAPVRLKDFLSEWERKERDDQLNIAGNRQYVYRARSGHVQMSLCLVLHCFMALYALCL